MPRNIVKDKITVDGIDYEVEHEDDAEGTIVLWVYDIHGQKIADATWDSDVEQVYYAYFNEEEGRLDDHDGSSSDLYRKGWREVAEWLCATHPEV